MLNFRTRKALLAFVSGFTTCMILARTFVTHDATWGTYICVPFALFLFASAIAPPTDKER